MRRPLFAANWKMNLWVRDVAGYLQGLESRVASMGKSIREDYDVVLAPPATHLTTLLESRRNPNIEISAQNSGTALAGAFTGENSPAVLMEMGVRWVILGHSERRHVFGETEEILEKRLDAALEAGLEVIYCVGEKIEARRAGDTMKVVESQLAALRHLTPGEWSRVVVAYEPVWAIGTGETATPEQAQEAHQFIRSWISEHRAADLAEQVRILYGGSANAGNSKSLMAQKDVDGLLVGSASLDAEKFADLIKNGLG